MVEVITAERVIHGIVVTVYSIDGGQHWNSDLAALRRWHATYQPWDTRRNHWKTVSKRGIRRRPRPKAAEPAQQDEDASSDHSPVEIDGTLQDLSIIRATHETLSAAALALVPERV